MAKAKKAKRDPEMVEIEKAIDKANAFVDAKFSPVLRALIEPNFDPTAAGYAIIYDTARVLLADIDDKDHGKLNSAIWVFIDAVHKLHRGRK